MTAVERARVMVVDDEPFYLELLSNLLDEDYDVVVARNGEQALRRAVSATRPDLILLDVVMPGMDGLEICRRLKADSLSSAIPVIFLTSRRAEQDELAGFELGAVDYIAKPVNPTLLKRRVSTHLALAGQRLALEELVRERTRELSHIKDALVFAMGAMAELRDQETGNHLARTEKFVQLLAEGLASKGRYREVLDPRTIYHMHRAAPLHDIGKVGVPDRILQKGGALDPDEYREMQKHPLFGRELIESVEHHVGATPFTRTAREIVYCHHEWWDGSGYPEGLRGEQIPLAARLMALADVYDALASRRRYKDPMPHQAVVEAISEASGTHFDPLVVEVFLERQQRFEQIMAELRDE